MEYKKPTQTKIVNIDKGRIPPQAVELEEAILGTIILFNRSADQVFQIIRDPQVFYLDKHKLLFAALYEMYNKNEPIDLLTVSDYLKRKGHLEKVGGDYALIKMTQVIFSSAHVEYHSRIVLQKHLKRKIIMLNNTIIEHAYDDQQDVFELVEGFQKEFDKVIDVISTGRKTEQLPESLQSLKLDIERLSSNKDEVVLTGVTTGFKRTDLHTGGYQEGDLVILAARPGMGKTAKALKCVLENLKRGVPVGVFSLEMSMKQLTARIVAIDTDFHLKQLLKSGFEKAHYFKNYARHAERMQAYPLVVDDSGISDITEIVIMAKAWKRAYGIKFLVIDYLQLMRDREIKGNREAEISNISRRLKLLAKELQLPILLLSQLSREVEKRGGTKRPVLSDLRDSGAIEQDADIVEFIYRPDYYGIDIVSQDYEDENCQRCVEKGGNSEIIYAKFRAGSVGTAILKWVGDKTKFVDVEDDNDTVNYIDQKLPTITTAQAFAGNTVFDGD